LKAYHQELAFLGFNVITFNFPGNIKQLLKLLHLIYFKKNKLILISTPPFSYAILSLLPFCKIILDIRDGWSIAIKSGYGGKVNKSEFKFKIASLLEKIFINLSYETVTVTKGLAEHLERVSGRKITIIENGYSGNFLEPNPTIEKLSSKETLNLICAGKFAEYGRHHVISLLKNIREEFTFQTCKINLVGCDKLENQWIQKHCLQNNLDITINIQDRLNKKALSKYLLDFDAGIVLLRNDSYEYGTKVFDYIQHGMPFFGNYSKQSNFYFYFRPYLENICGQEIYSRNAIMKNKLKNIL
jgi:hypothetical protein